LTGTGTTAAAAAIVHLGLPPLCSRAVDGDDDNNSDSDNEDVGNNIAAGGAKDGTMMHDGAMSSTQYLGGGHDECECDDFRRIIGVRNNEL
jgi:hypothetical protein